MPINICVPDNPVFAGLYENMDEVIKKFDARILPVNETQCSELMKANRVDAALLSPLGYGIGAIHSDYRIIPGPMLAAYGYSSFGALYFNKGLTTINTCSSPNPDDFLMLIGRILLSERYNLDIDFNFLKGSPDKLLEKSDSAITWSRGYVDHTSLDITELWSDSYNLPLPLAFWVCRAEEHPENILDIVNSLSAPGLKREEIVKEEFEGIDTFGREGTIFRQWDEDIEHSLDQVIQLLFFRQLIPEICAVKVLGRESDTQELK